MTEQLSWRLPPLPKGEPRAELVRFGQQREVWRVERRNDAYVDPSGQARDGYVVYEQVIVTIIDAEDHDDGYNVHKNGADIAVDEQGRRFRYTPNTVDYFGGGSWARIDENGKWLGSKFDGPGFWQRLPWMDGDHPPKGYFYEDGSAPVRPLL